MKRWTLNPAMAVLVCTAFTTMVYAKAQGIPTASRRFEPSVFLGVTGTYTGLEGSRNAGITAGFDLGFHPFFGLLPALEIRGTYPMNSGAVVGEESFSGGLRVTKRIGRFRPYANFLFGRGQLNYQNGGYVVPSQNFEYIQSTSNILSPGLGIEVDFTPHLSLLLDGQYQHWTVPFTPDSNSTDSSSIYSKAGTIGAVYRFNWLQHGHPAP